MGPIDTFGIQGCGEFQVITITESPQTGSVVLSTTAFLWLQHNNGNGSATRLEGTTSSTHIHLRGSNALNNLRVWVGEVPWQSRHRNFSFVYYTGLDFIHVMRVHAWGCTYSNMVEWYHTN